MNTDERIQAFVELGQYIRDNGTDIQEITRTAQMYNPWFTLASIGQSFYALSDAFLDANKLHEWLSSYPVETVQDKTIAIVAAGNIPMVAFHDILCVLISGNKLQLKLSDKDKHLLPFLLRQLISIHPGFADRIRIAEKLEKFDAIIATGSNNAATHFDHYFSKYKHIIRRNRNSVAVLDGSESDEELNLLGHDVFDYFGLGCRNVSKVYLPVGFDLNRFKTGFASFCYLDQHTPYMHNLDYQRTLYLMNGTPMVDIDFVNIIEHQGLHSPIASLYYAYYESPEALQQELEAQKDQIQCIVGKVDFPGIIPMGKSQQPGLKDYADHVDTMDFILKV